MFDKQEILQILNWATKPVQSTAEHQAIQEKRIPYWKEIEKVFPIDFLYELEDLEYKEYSMVGDEHFQRGFWLGLRLGQFAEQGPSGGIRNP